MPSPFPGMDPYIEEGEWEDFHQGFVAELAAALVPCVRPRYVVRKERRVYVEHPLADDDRPIRSDVAVLSHDNAMAAPEQPAAALSTATPVVVSLPAPEERREAFLSIREFSSMEVVTVIELLSPSNKRSGGDGRREYLRKREEILSTDTHLVELDLLRGGRRLPTVDPLPHGDFFAFICRTQRRYKAEVYAWGLRQPLPPIPIPLAGDDRDVQLDLQAVFTATYDRAGYDYSLDYSRPVLPALDTADTDWVLSLLGR
ncbi:MAG: DUF4058 family protein [Planctomycetes bacterium]|nr:DUF4058 family protein [Planctomycetota bacterium]MBL7043710.1 DUF4058 family protein [Pirellulaceae bacterium]